MKLKSRNDGRVLRHRRIRKKIRGTTECPRLSVMISNRHMHAQFVDDDKGVTLAAVSTLGMDAKNYLATAGLRGLTVLQRAQDAGIKRVVVDRGGHKFHGRVKAIVDPLKAAGLLTGTKEAT